MRPEIQAGLLIRTNGVAADMKRSGVGSDASVKTQFAALCYRVRKKKVQILMITSRRTKRWIIPKGWPMEDVSACEAAATEAWEEAGVTGKVSPDSIGFYTYLKEGEGKGPDATCATLVFPLRVKSIKRKYPERRERRRKWMSKKKAANLVWEPELAGILRNFKAD